MTRPRRRLNASTPGSTPSPGEMCERRWGNIYARPTSRRTTLRPGSYVSAATSTTCASRSRDSWGGGSHCVGQCSTLGVPDLAAQSTTKSQVTLSRGAARTPAPHRSGFLTPSTQAVTSCVSRSRTVGGDRSTKSMHGRSSIRRTEPSNILDSTPPSPHASLATVPKSRSFSIATSPSACKRALPRQSGLRPPWTKPGHREAGVLAFSASPSVDKQERGVARGPVENEMQGDVLRGAAGSPGCAIAAGDAGPAKTTRLDAEATAAFPRTPVAGASRELPGRCNCARICYSRARP